MVLFGRRLKLAFVHMGHVLLILDGLWITAAYMWAWSFSIVVAFLWAEILFLCRRGTRRYWWNLTILVDMGLPCGLSNVLTCLVDARCLIGWRLSRLGLFNSWWAPCVTGDLMARHLLLLLLGWLLIIGRLTVLTLKSKRISVALRPVWVGCRFVETAVQVLPVLWSLWLGAMEWTVLVQLA